MSRFALNRFHHLEFRLETGEILSPVHIVKAFPLTAPEADWSVVLPSGEEVFWIEKPSTLDAQDLALLGAYFAEREFCPIIERIDAVDSFSTPSRWHVTTREGACTLILQAEEDIRRLPSRALLITDRSGTQYRIPDRFALDRHSRKILDRFL